MIGFDLPPILADCPVYWKNFIHALIEASGSDQVGVSMPKLQCELKIYNARYKLSGSSLFDHIEFQTEQDLAWFVLKWT